MRYEQTEERMSGKSPIIVTGPIDSGKTSWCKKLADSNPECAGVLLLKVYLGQQRIGYDALRLPAAETLPFARLVESEPADWVEGERVGPFSISAPGLEAANTWLMEAADRPVEISIVDEIGPLELIGGGLAVGLRAMLASPFHQKLYIVIRTGFVEAVCQRFRISEFDLVNISAESSPPPQA
jgi:nucleoside-triphosphatase THEP1